MGTLYACLGLTMDNFADRLLAATLDKGNPCIVGLDPRINEMPLFVNPGKSVAAERDEAAYYSIMAFHKCVIDAIANLVPGVKLQSAFFEQYGLGGMRAFYDTMRYARNAGLIVIADAKRGDIGSTAAAYASAFLGETEINGDTWSTIDADCLTVSPYLGIDSLMPFVDECAARGRGIFVLAKTSNKGSADIQDLRLESGERVYERVAAMINVLSEQAVGKEGYSSIGAVVGATFPEEARKLRELLPKSILLVPGYGTQGGTAENAALCFDKNGTGAVVSASRSITYGFESRSVSETRCVSEIRRRTEAMITDINAAISYSRGIQPEYAED